MQPEELNYIRKETEKLGEMKNALVGAERSISIAAGDRVIS